MREPLVQSAPLLTRINVTPVIDVALVLVIILLITTPLRTVADIAVDLPPAQAQDLVKTAQISLTVAADGQIAVDDDVLANTQELTALIARRVQVAGADEMFVVVRADEKLSHAAVKNVMAAARAGGATKLGIATRQTKVMAP
ncbi:MAG: biopolymer transport protein ExbD [Candidatus Krumholzibacteriia bacterium]|jgi:biopolymer transport protein ExbD